MKQLNEKQLAPHQRAKLTNNALVTEQVADAARRIEIEIGDTKQPDFYPQFKTKHWDNEANFSLRLKADNYEADDIRVLVPAADMGKMTLAGSGEDPAPVSDLVEWEKDDRIVRMYNIDGFEDGGFVFEVELLAAPTENTIEYTLQTKGLNFFYQPEVTDEEAELARRGEDDTRTLAEIKSQMQPENVVGSYAVYHKDKRDNTVGGKHYRTGKAFHIFRPEAIDASGARVWCDISIAIDAEDDESGIMTVTIPQDFLDTAVYPVIIK